MESLVPYQAGAITSTNGFAALGEVANQHAANNVFADFLSRKATNTITAHRFDLASYAEYLDAALGAVSLETEEEARARFLTHADALQSDPNAWHGTTWGLVEGFVKWQLRAGHAISTVNRRLATVRSYAKLATKAGVIDAQTHAMIRLVSGYAGKEARHIDEKREVTRVGHKKAAHVSISKEQAAQLKKQPNTPQGRRDAVIMALLLDLGLRVGELAIIEVAHVNLKEGTIQVHRPKVNLTQKHKLSADCLLALRNWIDSGDCAPFGPLLRGSRKGGALTMVGMSETSISERVRTLGKEIGIAGLSAHDCRHHWTSKHVGAKNPDLNQIRQAGGWASLTMVLRYAENSKIANEGLV